MLDIHSKPLVSVLVPAYNCTETIKIAIASITAQSYSNIEIVVIDDGSSDRTYTVLQSLAKQVQNLRLYQNEENLGYLRTFNKLLSLAKGDYITFLDADDWIAPTKIEKQLTFMTQNPEYGFCGTGFSRTNSKGKVYQEVLLPSRYEEINNHLEKEIEVCFCGSSIMVRKQVVEEIGGYNEYFMGCPAEDYDWIRRMANKYPCYNLQESLYFYRFSVNSLTRNVSYDVKAQSAAELAKFFDVQRSKYQGEDALSDAAYLPELERFLIEKQKDFDNYPERLEHRIALNEAIHGNVKNVGSALCRLTKINPFRAIVTALISAAVLIVPNNLLLELKAFIKK